MFTGLIQQCGVMVWQRRRDGGRVVRVDLQHPYAPPLIHGESIAVQGICLTVTACDPKGFEADLLDETWQRGAWSTLPNGSLLNLERALRLGDPLGGHWVTGHVDETGVIEAIEPVGRDWRLRVRCSQALGRLIVPKGSIAIDGVSLTVVNTRADAFDTQIIPTTWRETTLHTRKAGDRVNLEADLIAKHVQRLLAPMTGANTDSLTMSALEQAGFAT